MARPSTATIKGVSHSLKGGGRLLALAYQEDDALVVSYRFDKPGQKTRLVEARLPEPGVPALWPVLWMQVCQRQ